jgi:uncharacterized membrane protein
MNLRPLVFELIARHRLSPTQAQRLQQLANPSVTISPALLWRAVAGLAAGLFGLGLMMWIAANWAGLGRLEKFSLLQTLVLASCAGAALRPLLRAPLGMLALFAIGGLWAYFGQTYQTGADAWQLFALWAALALPLCLMARSDLVWLPWTVVTTLAISLWTHTHMAHRWELREGQLGLHLMSFGLFASLCLLLAPNWRKHTGAGLWSLRYALTASIAAITLAALGGLFEHIVLAQYWLGLFLLGGAVLLLGEVQFFDIFGLSAAALGCNVLLICGVARWLFDNERGNSIGIWLLLGLLAAAALAGTVSLILAWQRRYAANLIQEAI